MNDSNPAKSVYTAVLAGVRIFANRPLHDLPETGDCDRELRIRFVPAGSAELDLPPGAHRLPETGYPQGWLSGDGREAVVAEPHGATFDVGMAVRGVLPFASALQGAVVLHASAVLGHTGIHAFVAASGTGKSTLAAELARQGLPLVADDLTPCRVTGDAVQVPLPALHPQRTTGALLRGLFFLGRDARSNAAACQPLPPARCMELLIWNGFGELESKQAWSAQFGVYEQLARRVPAYALTVPDNRERIARTTAEVHQIVASLDPPAGR